VSVCVVWCGVLRMLRCGGCVVWCGLFEN